MTTDCVMCGSPAVARAAATAAHTDTRSKKKRMRAEISIYALTNELCQRYANLLHPYACVTNIKCYAYDAPPFATIPCCQCFFFCIPIIQRLKTTADTK